MMILAVGTVINVTRDHEGGIMKQLMVMVNDEWTAFLQRFSNQ